MSLTFGAYLDNFLQVLQRSRTVSIQMASGDLFQMDQTAFTNQKILWHLRECCQDTNLDCGIHVSIGRNIEKKVENRRDSLHYFTNFEHHLV